jgi:acetolactate synthase-1/2/3 large subunit
MGPLQGTPHAEILRPVTRLSRTLRIADQVLRELDHAVGCASGAGNLPGPVYVEIPTDVLRATIAAAAALPEYLARRPVPRTMPDPAAIEQAAALLRDAKRALVISGRGAAGAAHALTALLDATDALYLDTQESRGLVAAAHPAHVGAMRAVAMRDADLC